MTKLDSMYYSITVQEPDMLKIICNQYLSNMRIFKSEFVCTTIKAVVSLLDKTSGWGSLCNETKEKVICFMFLNADFFLFDLDILFGIILIA